MGIYKAIIVLWNKSMENPMPICSNIFRKSLMEADIMGLRIGVWLHDTPDTEYNSLFDRKRKS